MAKVPKRKTAKSKRAVKTSGFGQSVLASLSGWERGELLTERGVAEAGRSLGIRPQRPRRAGLPAL